MLSAILNSLEKKKTLLPQKLGCLEDELAVGEVTTALEEEPCLSLRKELQSATVHRWPCIGWLIHRGDIERPVNNQ